MIHKQKLKKVIAAVARISTANAMNICVGEKPTLISANTTIQLIIEIQTSIM